MKKVLLTGVAGTGKSTLCTTLIGLGYEACDLEKVDGLFKMYRKDTGEEYVGFDNSVEHIQNSVWRCDPKALASLLSNQKADMAFYAGTASNMEDIVPLFDQTILLVAKPENVYKRLMNREGQNDMGGSEESRQAVLGWQDWWDGEMKDLGAVPVPADGISEETATLVLRVSI